MIALRKTATVLRSHSSESCLEADAAAARLTNGLAVAEHPHRSFPVDDEQVVDPVLVHQRHRSLDARRSGHGDGLGGHPLPNRTLGRDARERRRHATGRVTSGSRSAGRTGRPRPNRCRARASSARPRRACPRGRRRAGRWTSPLRPYHRRPRPPRSGSRAELIELLRGELDLDLHGARGSRRLRRALEAGEAGEEGRQVTADDLRRRPPERLRAAAASDLPEPGELAAQIARPATREEQPAQNGAERLRARRRRRRALRSPRRRRPPVAQRCRLA